MNIFLKYNTSILFLLILFFGIGIPLPVAEAQTCSNGQQPTISVNGPMCGGTLLPSNVLGGIDTSQQTATQVQ